jgi:spore maturation protein SpmB
VPTLIATICSTTAAISAYYLLSRLRRFRAEPLEDAPPPEATPDIEEPVAPVEIATERKQLGKLRGAFLAVTIAVLAIGLVREISREIQINTFGAVAAQIAEFWLIPLLIVGLLLVGVSGRVRLYESAAAGAREGLDVVVRIVPFLVVILVAVAMFRASGALGLLVSALDPITSLVGFPAEALPMAILRPLTGSGAYAVMAEILETQGPDSFVGLLTSTLQGSTETTFYVLTVYCGAAGIRNVRHALPACLIGDLAGAAGATAACHLFFG